MEKSQSFEFFLAPRPFTQHQLAVVSIFHIDLENKKVRKTEIPTYATINKFRGNKKKKDLLVILSHKSWNKTQHMTSKNFRPSTKWPCNLHDPGANASSGAKDHPWPHPSFGEPQNVGKKCWETFGFLSTKKQENPWFFIIKPEIIGFHHLLDPFQVSNYKTRKERKHRKPTTEHH